MPNLKKQVCNGGYIEKYKNNLIYKSRGGITIDNNEKSEYEELINKIYIPI